MKKILLLADWYEPGYKAGGPIQSCRNFVSHMHDQYELYMITGNRDVGESRPYEHLPFDQWTDRGGQVKVFYTDPATLGMRKMASLIRGVDPDYILMNSMYSFRFTILPLLLKWRNRIRASIVLAPRGMLQQGAMKFKTQKKMLFIRLLSGMKIADKIIFQATDEQEEKDILRYFPRARVRRVSNFTGTGTFNVLPIEKAPATIRAVYISRIIPKKNLLFFIGILADVHASFEVSFNIYGEIEDKVYWTKCQEAIGKLKTNVTVQYHGPLPHEEVNRVLEQHHLFVLPTEGENFGHAIYEAFSCGRPVLISDQTPWKNLESQEVGWDIPLYAPGLFVNGLSQAIAFDQQTFNTWSSRAASYAAAYAAKSNVKEDYLKLFS